MLELPLATLDTKIIYTEQLGLAHSEVLPTESNVIKKIATATLSGVSTITEALKDKEKRRTIIALGTLGVATTIAEYKGLAQSWPQPFAAIRDSERHLEVGYISALLASKKEYASKRSKVGGMLLAGFIGNIVAETAQSVIVIGFIQDRWKHIADFLLPSQIFWNNTQDAAAAMLAAGYAAFRENKR